MQWLITKLDHAKQEPYKLFIIKIIEYFRSLGAQ